MRQGKPITYQTPQELQNQSFDRDYQVNVVEGMTVSTGGTVAPSAAEIRSAVGLASADLDTQLGDIQTDLDNPDQYKADVSALATEANATSNKNEVIAEVEGVTGGLTTDEHNQLMKLKNPKLLIDGEIIV